MRQEDNQTQSQNQEQTASTGAASEKSQKAGRSRQQLPWWRRTYLVNRELQLRFAGSALIVGLVSSSLAAGMMLWSFWVFNIWQGQRLPVPALCVILFVMLINASGIFVAAVLATHKVVGPIFNLLRQFQRLSHADFSATARFRQSDEMHYVARRFNELVMALRVRNEFIMSKIDEATEALNQGDVVIAQQALDSVRQMRDRETQICGSAQQK